MKRGIAPSLPRVRRFLSSKAVTDDDLPSCSASAREIGPSGRACAAWAPLLFCTALAGCKTGIDASALQANDEAADSTDDQHGRRAGTDGTVPQGGRRRQGRKQEKGPLLQSARGDGRLPPCRGLDEGEEIQSGRKSLLERGRREVQGLSDPRRRGLHVGRMLLLPTTLCRRGRPVQPGDQGIHVDAVPRRHQPPQVRDRASLARLPQGHYAPARSSR